MAILTGTFGNDDIGGTLQGDLILALSGNDTVVGSAGADTIDGGSGDDILYANTRNNVDDGDFDLVTGGDGNDIVYGSAGDNLNGNLGRDTLYLDLSSANEGVSADFREMTLGVDLGLGGLIQIDLPLLTGTLGGFEIVKRIEGSAFADEFIVANVGKVGAYIDGGAGDDSIKASGGGDTLIGGDGADRLSSARGRDSLDGGAGDDLLIGGGGQDTLTGGTGADSFVFDTSAGGRSGTDRVTDFSHADGDRLVFAGMDANIGTPENDRFHFIGADKFSSTAGELRFNHVDGNTFVRGDVDGDGNTDFMIQIDGVVDLTAADFKL